MHMILGFKNISHTHGLRVKSYTTKQINHNAKVSVLYKIDRIIDLGIYNFVVFALVVYYSMSLTFYMH